MRKLFVVCSLHKKQQNISSPEQSSEDDLAQENVRRDASVVDDESNDPSETQHTDEEKEVGIEPPRLV